MDIKFINKLIDLLKESNVLSNNSISYNFRKVGEAFCDYIKIIGSGDNLETEEQKELYEKIYNAGLYISKVELAGSLSLIDDIPYFIIKDSQKHYAVYLKDDEINIYEIKKKDYDSAIKDFILFLGKEDKTLPLPPEREITRDFTNIPKPIKGVNFINKAAKYLKKSGQAYYKISENGEEIIESFCKILMKDEDILDDLQMDPDEIEIKKISLVTAIPFIYIIGRKIDPNNIEAWKGFFVYNDGKEFRVFVPESGNWTKEDSPKVSYLPDYNRCFKEFEQLFPEEERSDFKEDKIKKSSSETLLELQRTLGSFKNDKDISKVLLRINEELDIRRKRDSNVDKNVFVGNYYRYDFPTDSLSYTVFFIKSYDGAKNNFIADIISFDGFNKETEELEGFFITFNQEIAIQTQLDKSNQSSFNMIVDEDKLYYNETVLKKFTNPGMLVKIKNISKMCSQIKADK